MKTVSAIARTAVTRGHVRHTRVQAYSATGVPGPYVPVTSGEVTFTNQGTSGSRAGRFSVPGYQWAPVVWTAPLAPFGQWVTVEIGIQLDSGAIEWFALGQFPIYAVEITRPGGTVEVTIGDWALRVDRAVLESGRAWGPDVRAIDLFATLLREAFGTTTVVDRNDIGTATLNTRVVAKPGESRWRIITDIADLLGCYPVLTARNRLSVIRRDETPGLAVETLRTGEAGTVVRSSTQIDALSGYNRFVAIVADSDADEPESFTAVTSITTGPFRYDPKAFGVMPYVRTEAFPGGDAADAQTLSRQDYFDLRGVPRKWTVEAVPMPWLEVNDSVGIVGPDGATVARIATVTFPFSVNEAMTVDTQDLTGATFGPPAAYPFVPYPGQTYPSVV